MVSLYIYIYIYIYNTIKYLLLNEIISIDFVKSKENIVDLLIKSLLRECIIHRGEWA